MTKSTSREALGIATQALRASGIEQPAREARLLLALALGLPSGAVPDPDTAIPEGFWSLLDRRAAHEPMARLRGHQGFWTLDLGLSPQTLIPRADSESVIEAAVAACATRATVRRVLDLGTGTGALLLAALVEFPAAWGLGVDLVPAACSRAAANAAANGLSARAAFVCGDWNCAVAATFDLVLCNPPYVASGELTSLMPEVALHDPVLALDGGVDGLDAYRAIAPGLSAVLSHSGHAVLEHGEGQGAAVAAILHGNGLEVMGTRTDLGGIARVVVARRQAS